MSVAGLDNEFIYALQTIGEERNEKELNVIYSRLYGLETLSSLQEQNLRALCALARYETHEANEILYRKSDPCSCWYILLSGAVYIQGSMFEQPFTSFGKQIPGTKRRGCQCIVLEDSEMIAIDYPDMTLHSGGINTRPHALRQTNSISHNPLDSVVEVVTSSSEASPIHRLRSNSLPKSSNGQAIMILDNESQSSFSKDLDDDDYTEPDLDEEDSISLHSESSIVIKDLVIEVLKKDVGERNSEDLEILLEFTKSLRAFSNMTEPIRRALCKVMVFAWVGSANTVVLKNNELLDSWSVIINGQVEVIHDDEDKLLGMGDSFGVEPTLQPQHHKGVMTTICDDCQFLCVAQQEYFDVLHQGQENIENIFNENGELVMVKEKRELDEDKTANIVIRGTPDQLMQHLLEENAVDATYAEDFLLTYRTFGNEPLKICRKLLEWFDKPMFRDKVIRIILLWVNNHFNDFESDWHMMALLEQFDEKLQKYNLLGQTKLFNIACSAKAKPRVVSITRPSFDVELGFFIMGGSEQNFPIYISTVTNGSDAELKGVKRGDQLLEVNGQNFEKLTMEKAQAILKKNTDLALTLKTNLFAFKEMIAELKNPTKGKKNKEKHPSFRGSRISSTMTSAESELYADAKQKKEIPEDVIKVYKADQTFRFLFVSRDTTAGDAVQAACREFGITDDTNNYALYRVSVQGEKFVKQSKLPDPLSKLADIPLGARYYLKNTMNSEQLLPDENIPELLKEANFSFLDLNCFEVALYLTREDYKLFQMTEPNNFIDDLFRLESDLKKFREFEDLVNRELFWVVTTLCKEHNVIQRSKMIKHFCKIAHNCKVLKNLNSTFALVSGLGYRAVSRMKQSWEKVPAKSNRLFEELQALMDPSRNMSKYRTLLNEYISQPPVIPYIPVVKKDLTFLHLGNDTKVEGLINFEKMRMIAKEIRSICRLCAPDSAQIIPSAQAAQQKDSDKGAIYQTLARRGRRASFNNARRMYEDQMNVRRVKQYMQQIDIITDEDKLMEMSKLVEPQAAPSSAQARRRFTTTANPLDSPSRSSKTLPLQGGRNNSTGSTGSLQMRNNSEPHLLSAPPVVIHPTKKKAPSSTLPKYGIGQHSPQMISRKLLALSEEAGDRNSRGKRGKETKRSASVSSHEYSPTTSPYMTPKHSHVTKPDADGNHTIGFENMNINNNRHSLPAGTGFGSVSGPPSPGVTSASAYGKKFFPHNISTTSSCRSSIASASSLGTVSSSNPSSSSLGGSNSPRSSSPVPWSSSGSLSSGSTASPRLLHSQHRNLNSPNRSSSNSSADTVKSASNNKHTYHERPVIKQTRNGRSSSFGGGSMGMPSVTDRRLSQMTGSTSSPTLTAHGSQAPLILPNHPRIPRTPSIDSGVVSAGSLSADSARFNLADENEIFARSYQNQHPHQLNRVHPSRHQDPASHSRQHRANQERPKSTQPSTSENNNEKVEQTFLSGSRGQGDPPRPENKDPYAANLPIAATGIPVDRGKFVPDNTYFQANIPPGYTAKSSSFTRSMLRKSSIKGIHEFLVCERHAAMQSHYYRNNMNSNNNNCNPIMQPNYLKTTRTTTPEAILEEQLVQELQKQKPNPQKLRRKAPQAQDHAANLINLKRLSLSKSDPLLNNVSESPDYLNSAEGGLHNNLRIKSPAQTSSPKLPSRTPMSVDHGACLSPVTDNFFNASDRSAPLDSSSQTQYTPGSELTNSPSFHSAYMATRDSTPSSYYDPNYGYIRENDSPLVDQETIRTYSVWEYQNQAVYSKSLDTTKPNIRTKLNTSLPAFTGHHAYAQSRSFNGPVATNGYPDSYPAQCDTGDASPHCNASRSYASPLDQYPGVTTHGDLARSTPNQYHSEQWGQLRRKTSQEWSEIDLDTEQKQQTMRAWGSSTSLPATPLSAKHPAQAQSLPPRTLHLDMLQERSESTESRKSSTKPPPPPPPQRTTSIGRTKQLRQSSSTSPPPSPPSLDYDGLTQDDHFEPSFSAARPNGHQDSGHAAHPTATSVEQGSSYERKSLPTYNEAVHQINSKQSPLFKSPFVGSYRPFGIDNHENKEQVSQV